MKKVILLSLLLYSFHASGESLSKRLNGELTRLEQKMTTRTFEGKARDLLNKGGREEAFRLQAYGRLFEKNLEDLSILRDQFKILEDHIGQCKKWSDLLKDTTLSSSKKSEYTEYLNKEIEHLAELLRTWKEGLEWEAFKELAQDVYYTAQETLKIAKKNSRREIEDLISKKYDFKYGETGLHELRRNIRWPKIYLEIFSDVLRLKTSGKVCKSKNDLYELGKESNEITFKTNISKDIILIDDCAYCKLVGAVELLGNIKDELEKEEILEDKLPKKLKEQVEKIHKELVEEILPDLYQ